MSLRLPIPPVWRLTPLFLLLAGCGRDQIVSYRVPKENPPANSALPASHPTVAGAPHPAMPSATPTSPPASAPAGAAMAATPVATANGNALTWTAPAAWTAKAPSTMRKGSYVISGPGGATADLAITAFPGDVGGEVANVNRWRGQVQLAPLSDTEASAAVTRLSVDGLAIGVVDFTGTEGNATRLLGAMVPYGGNTWFFKLLGPAPVVGEARAAFLDFLKTIRPATP